MTAHHSRPHAADRTYARRSPGSREVSGKRRRAFAAGAALVAVVVALAAAALLFAPGVALAAAGTRAQTPAVAAGWVLPGQAVAPAASLEAVLTNIRNWIMGIAGALTTVFVTIGGVRYLAAGGDLGEVEKAKTAFRSAGYGFAIVVLAPVLVGVFSSIVGA